MGMSEGLFSGGDPEHGVSCTVFVFFKEGIGGVEDPLSVDDELVGIFSGLEADRELPGIPFPDHAVAIGIPAIKTSGENNAFGAG